MTVPEKILEKIAKLLELQNNSGATQAESENAAARIQEMLMKYNLEMDQVEQHLGKEKKSKVIHTQISLEKAHKKTDGSYATDLLNTLAYNNLCKMLSIRTPGSSYVRRAILIGEEQNLAIVLRAFYSLRNQIVEAEKIAWKVYDGDITNRNTYKRGYYQGAVDGIREKLRESKEELIKLNEGMGLMVISKEAEVEKYTEDWFNPTTKKPSSRQLSGWDGYAQGYEKGKQLQHHKGIE